MHQRYHTFDVASLHENSSLRKRIQKYKLKNASLQQQLSASETENQIKDRQLDEQLQHIITITSENLRLKQEMAVLRRQLNIKNKSILLNKKRRKKLSAGKRNKLNRTELTYEYSYSDMSSMCNDGNNMQLPYLIPTMHKSVSEISESNESNLSEVACRLSFPHNDSNPPYVNKSYTPTMLQPIAENKCDIDYNNNIIIRISDNNTNIDDEWGDCIADISPVHKKNNININSLQMIGNNLDDDDSSSESSYTDSDNDNISYMSDNTVLLMDMNFSKNKLEMADYGNTDLSPKTTESVRSNSISNNCGNQFMLDQVSCARDQLFGVDAIVTSPICNILERKNVNTSNFKLNEDNVSIIDVENNYNNEFKFK